MVRKIKWGLPRGSLNKVGRGNTEALLVDAGYEIEGYTPENERSDQLRIKNDPELEVTLVRPQNAPGDLGRKLLDIAIIGDDWVQEESDVTKLIKLADLEYGTIKVVTAVPKDFEATTLTDLFLSYFSSERREPMSWYVEYPKLARGYFLKNHAYQKLFGDKLPLIEIRSFIIEGENDRIRIIYSEGTTEEYLKKGFPIIDNLQTGETLEQVGGRILEDGEIMVSSAGLYARPNLEGDDWLWEKANDIRDKLLGVVMGRKYDDVKFNVETQFLDSVIAYIKKEGLALRGPTVSQILGPSGIEGYAINIVVPKAKYPEVSATLKKRYGATGMVRSDIKQLIL
ncbi:MAG: ATP phosphoribosyltransferase [Candidatus Aenigmarchaeota archaeon]|nr:ATP phosphoribosyltransferase [Candidatus Aenigmarchaeota archaeon]